MANELVLPKDDFADEQFDYDFGTMPRTLLLVLSTPRSGSTLACNILHLAGVCTAHEYFQPYQIRPAMTHRWGLKEGDVEAYCANLVRYRTSRSGVLGINLHAKHLKYFEHARHYLPDSIQTVRYVWISRRDKVAQAVSYEIASQTKQWSSDFEKTLEPQYDYNSILRRLRDLQISDLMISFYLWRRGQFACRVRYESFAANYGLVLKAAGSNAQLATTPSINRQAGKVNAEMVARFRRNYSPWHGGYDVRRRSLKGLRITWGRLRSISKLLK